MTTGKKIVEREIKDDNVRRVVAVCCYSLERVGTRTDVCWSGPQNVGEETGEVDAYVAISYAQFSFGTF